VRRPRADALVTALALVVTPVVAGVDRPRCRHSSCTPAPGGCAGWRPGSEPDPDAADADRRSVFLKRGIAVFKPELVALERLRPGGDLAKSYTRALDATRAELAALQST